MDRDRFFRPRAERTRCLPVAQPGEGPDELRERMQRHHKWVETEHLPNVRRLDMQIAFLACRLQSRQAERDAWRCCDPLPDRLAPDGAALPPLPSHWQTAILAAKLGHRHLLVPWSVLGEYMVDAGYPERITAFDVAAIAAGIEPGWSTRLVACDDTVRECDRIIAECKRSRPTGQREGKPWAPLM